MEEKSQAQLRPFSLQLLHVKNKSLLSTPHLEQLCRRFPANFSIPSHEVAHGATFLILEGYGMAVVQDTVINLEPGVLLFIPPHAPHQITTREELLIFSTLFRIESTQAKES